MVNDFNLEEDFVVQVIVNEKGSARISNFRNDKKCIYFKFAATGSVVYEWPENKYILKEEDGDYLIFYFPNESIAVEERLKAKSSMIRIGISYDKFHALLAKSDDYSNRFFSDVKSKNYVHLLKTNSEPLKVVLNDILMSSRLLSNQELFIKGKTYELFSLIFHRPLKAQENSCPFLMDNEYFLKVKQAKDVLIANKSSATPIAELAKKVGLNTKKLKEGFKQIYGKPIYQYFLDYKLTFALEQLNKNKDQSIKDLSYLVGYSSPSHFIEAFKKKFGVTPKQYLLTKSKDLH